MLIEVHMIQNHAPSNLNRDDTGSPKDCIFGGVRRARISSQCLKRSIRRSPVFSAGLEGIDLGLRTRLLPQQIKQILLERGLAPELATIAAAKATGFGNKEGKEQADGKTAQIMFLSARDIEAVADVLCGVAERVGTAKEFEKVSAKDLQAQAELRGWRPITPDIALFGRMITSEAFRDVEASAQVAHAISTHKMDHEFDYFTAVDDLQHLEPDDESGAGMIGDVEFNSACYYKYFSLDYDGLVANLIGPPAMGTSCVDPNSPEATRARLVASQVIPSFIEAAAFTTPTGKQNTFAAHQLPDAVLVEIRSRKIPVSYANAFVKPARVTAEKDLVEDSLARFIEHVEAVTRKYSLQAEPRLWFSVRDIEIAGTTPCSTLCDLISGVRAALA